jgi:PQQ-dependent catabolism-associated CXXCW motif protein
MTIEVHGERVFASGTVGEEGDLQRFTEALARPGVTELVLVNSPGGDQRTAMAMAALLVPRKLRILAAGRCMSACSILFMAGAERQFASGVHPQLTMIGFHGAARGSSKTLDPSLQPRMYAYYKERFGARFDELLMSKALYGITDAGGMLRVREMQRNSESLRVPFYCPAGDTPRKDCVSYEGKDALSLGVVTSAQTVPLTLPDAFKPRFVFFGKTLEQEAHDPVDTIVQAASAMCRRSRQCAVEVAQGATRWLEQLDSRAFAVGTSRAGYAWRVGSSTPLAAAAGALYACNHDKTSPKLCRLAMADRHDLNQYYLESERQTVDAAARLVVPARPAWADEERDAAVPAPVGLRKDRLQAPTPRQLPAVSTITTGALVQRLLAPARPVLIDVDGAGPDMLPGALHFWNGGLALADEALESAYDERFRKMLELAAPDRNKPVLFYCAGPDCWLAVNAALRAVRAGYQEVLWYRGGLASWRAAELPLVQKVPSAMLN